MKLAKWEGTAFCIGALGIGLAIFGWDMQTNDDAWTKITINQIFRFLEMPGIVLAGLALVYFGVVGFLKKRRQKSA